MAHGARSVGRSFGRQSGLRRSGQQCVAKARGGPERPEAAVAARSRTVEVGGEMEVYWPARTGREGRKRVRCGAVAGWCR